MLRTAATVKFKDYSDEERRDMAKKGWALPDGSFPIANRTDLRNALHRIGTTKHARSAVIAHIRKRARALGATDMLGEKTAPAKASSHATFKANINDHAQFSERQVTDNGMIIRRGKIYEAGPRFDMHGIPFNVDETDLARMVVEFEEFDAEGKPTIPIGSGHPEAPSPLDGHMGHISNLYLSPDQKELLAESQIPPFIDEILGEGAAHVSAVFDRWAKKPISVDFVENPNVVDAALTASFAKFAARHDTPAGKSSMQAIHDVAARRGAVCRNMVAYGSLREQTAVQRIHDITTDHGADCYSTAQNATLTPSVTTAATSTTAAETTAVVNNAASRPAPAPEANQAKKERGMGWSFMDLFDGFFRAAKKNGIVIEDNAEFASNANDIESNAHDNISSTTTTEDCDESCCASDECSCGDCPKCGMRSDNVTEANPPASRMAATTTAKPETAAQTQPITTIQTTTNTDSASDTHSEAIQVKVQPQAVERVSMTTDTVEREELEELRNRARQLEAQLERERAVRIESEAAAFADGEVSALRSLPAETEILKELYRQASADDVILGSVKMADGTQTTRTQRLKDLMAMRSEHFMTKELLTTALHPEVLMAAVRTAEANEPKPMDKDAKTKYLEMTDAGRATLARINGNGNGHK